MDPFSTDRAPIDPAIYTKFHAQIRQHGPALLSFIAEQLGSVSPPALSVTLERIEYPPGEVNYAWFVGVPDAATERGVTRFFQSARGERALVYGGGDGAERLEFKLATTLLRVVAGGGSRGDGVALPAGLAVAQTPLRDDQEVVVVLMGSGSRPVRVVNRARGWLQTSPRAEFSQVWHLHVEELGRK
jgi:hypothetical protein